MTTAGSYEYVISTYSNASSSTNPYNFLGGDSSRSYATEPYADIFSASIFNSEFSSENSNKCTYELCGGQALYETRTVQSETSKSSKISWGDSYSDFVSSSLSWYRWLRRGGGYSGDAGGVGIFSATAGTGDATLDTIIDLIREIFSATAGTGDATSRSTFRPVIININ